MVLTVQFSSCGNNMNEVSMWRIMLENRISCNFLLGHFALFFYTSTVSDNVDFSIFHILDFC